MCVHTCIYSIYYLLSLYNIYTYISLCVCACSNLLFLSCFKTVSLAILSLFYY